MEFEHASEMRKYINSRHDLYSRKAQIYVFNRADGAICAYKLDKKEAEKLASDFKINKNAPWSALLSKNCTVKDDPVSILYYCADLIRYKDWMHPEDYFKAPAYVEVKLNIELTQEDIDDMMTTALEGGINYWCDKAEVIEDEYYGEYASEQISRGGSLRLYDSETNQTYILNLEKLTNGFKIWAEKGYDRHDVIINSGIECGNLDANAADGIIQCALFGDIMYG